jgi:ATP-dependent DNA helicase 2 subunit 2
MERSYHSVDDLDNEVPPDEKVKGYKYGRTLVPFSTVDEAVLKYQSVRCLQIIGFTKAVNVPRMHRLLKPLLLQID